MIRRWWSRVVGWLMQDDPDHELREAAAELATAIKDLSDEQQQHLFAEYTAFWWHANRVADCVRDRPGGIV